MFEWLNKYTLELAIDQEKTKKWENPELEWDNINWFYYWNQSFMSREQAFYWIRKQTISEDNLMVWIEKERKKYLEKWEKSPLEDLMQVYEKYYYDRKRETTATKENLQRLVEERAKKNPIIYESEDKWLLWYSQDEVQKYKPSERILPLTDILNRENSDETLQFNEEELGKFIQLSIKELSWEEISLAQAKDIASRIVIITWSDMNWKINEFWNWFIYNWSIWTNNHMVENEELELINIRDLQWNEFKDVKIHQIGNSQTKDDTIATKWTRDIAYITSSSIDLQKFKSDPKLSLLWSYIIWVKKIENEISLWWSSNKYPIALYINKVTIKDNPEDSWEWVIYTKWATSIPWTSWSMILHNWEIVWVHSWGQNDIIYMPFLKVLISSTKWKDYSWWWELFEWKTI
jgi:hypothetical protein